MQDFEQLGKSGASKNDSEVQVEKALIELNEVRNDLIIQQKEADVLSKSEQKTLPNRPPLNQFGGTSTSFATNNQNQTNMNFTGANFFINTQASGFYNPNNGGSGLLGNLD